MTHVYDYKGEKSYKQHEGRKYLSQFFERYAYMILYCLVAYAHGFGNLLVGHAAGAAHKKYFATEGRHSGNCRAYHCRHFAC